MGVGSQKSDGHEACPIVYNIRRDTSKSAGEKELSRRYKARGLRDGERGREGSDHSRWSRPQFQAHLNQSVLPQLSLCADVSPYLSPSPSEILQCLRHEDLGGIDGLPGPRGSRSRTAGRRPFSSTSNVVFV